MKKRIMMSLMIIGLISALVGGATFAWFTDTAVNEGNTFSAGTVDLELDRENAQPLFGDPTSSTAPALIDTTNVYPGWEGNATIKVSNAGTLPIEWYAFIEGSGSLQDVLEVKIESPNVGTGTETNPLVLQDWTALSNLMGNDLTTNMSNAPLKWDGDTAGAMQTNYDDIEYDIYVRVLTTASDTYQGASFTGDIKFSAIQYPNEP
ncbi:TasA family protein [Phosphitispora fastidiosa]|uniref:TasA family protein n=1 Tax=Phosphitispora fastidiosa TaxID=2837202 RepID=UPI001E52BCEB|nr:TasA family protein [Phosphitispora fastidiosa]MBU7005675.1 putative ribosomally synthesized peptide with SipW-like signal peptide [Phosphitispora fastidiosa]